MRLTKLLGFVMACALVFNSTSIAYAAEANPSDRETPVITQQAMGEVVPIVQNQARVAGNVSAGYVTGYLDAASDYDIYTVILSILVYTFFSRMFDLMLPPVAKHSIAVA